MNTLLKGCKNIYMKVASLWWFIFYFFSILWYNNIDKKIQKVKNLVKILRNVKFCPKQKLHFNSCNNSCDFWSLPTSSNIAMIFHDDILPSLKWHAYHIWIFFYSSWRKKNGQKNYLEVVEKNNILIYFQY